jgi:hypothetical protein
MSARAVAERRAEEAAHATSLIHHRAEIAHATLTLKRTIFFGHGAKFENAVQSHLDRTIETGREVDDGRFRRAYH